MRFFEDLRTKWGFDDGENIPAGIETVREIYIKAINHHARKLGSSLEAYPYDRPGMHNWCLILLRPVGSTQDEEHEPDEAMTKAFEECEGIELDELFHFEIEPIEDYKEELAALLAE